MSLSGVLVLAVALLAAIWRRRLDARLARTLDRVDERLSGISEQISAAATGPREPDADLETAIGSTIELRRGAATDARRLRSIAGSRRWPHQRPTSRRRRRNPGAGPNRRGCRNAVRRPARRDALRLGNRIVGVRRPWRPEDGPRRSPRPRRSRHALRLLPPPPLVRCRGGRAPLRRSPFGPCPRSRTRSASSRSRSARPPTCSPGSGARSPSRRRCPRRSARPGAADDRSA